MDRPKVGLIVTALCVSASIAVRPSVGSQDRGTQVEQSRGVYDEVAFGRLQGLAREAKHHEPSAVRAVVDEIFDGNMITRGAPESLRDRISRADLAMRSGTGRGVRVTDAVAGINEAVQRLGLPVYFRTTPDQVRSFRHDYSYATRNVALPSLSPAGTESMSPNEALFIITEMALQKVLVDENRVTPEAWDQRRRQREQEFEKSGKAALAQERVLMTAKVQRQRLEIPIPDLSSENAAGTVELHRILDSLGVPR